MTSGIGQTLWNLYEEAVRNAPDNTEGGVAGATLKLIEAFEQDLNDAGINLYNQSPARQGADKLAKIRQCSSRLY